MHSCCVTNQSDGTTTYFILNAVLLYMQSILSVSEVIQFYFRFLVHKSEFICYQHMCYLYSKTDVLNVQFYAICFVACAVKLRHVSF